MAPLKLPAFLQRRLKIRIQSREHLGFRPRPHHNHVLRARVPLFVNVDAEPNFLPRWLINHEITPSRALRQKHRLQQLDRKDWVFRLLAGDFFPSLDGAVHIDDRLKDVFLLPPCSKKLFDVVQVLDVLLPMLHVLLDARLPLLRFRPNNADRRQHRRKRVMGILVQGIHRCEDLAVQADLLLEKHPIAFENYFVHLLHCREAVGHIP